MKYAAHINVMPLKELLDPQGKAVSTSLAGLGIEGIQDVRIGKHILLHVEAANAEEAKAIATTACQKLLVNRVMESFEVSITE
jgi:phosphoribosylformylglycinamidine synthase subunit PurS